MSYRRMILAVFSLVVFFPCAAFSQDVGKQQQTERQTEEEKLLRERIEAPLPEAPVEEQPAAAQAPLAGDQKAFIKTIKVTGVTLLTSREISRIVTPFENKELTLSDMQKVVDLITDAYRSKGYVTSRAHLPPQKIQGNVLEILAVEGTTGDIEVKGNRFFRSGLIAEGIRLEKGRPFEYGKLRSSLARLNEHPDRTVKAVLVPGKEPGSTDIVLNVEDRLPLHYRIEWDNYASRYVGKDRLIQTVTHNNLCGYDDILSLQFAVAEKEDYRLLSLRYLFPASDATRIGVYASRSKIRLGREYRTVDARGKSRIYGLFSITELLNRSDFSVNLNTGFDYIDSFNFQAGAEQSRDRLRVLKVGLDLDSYDFLNGRTIVSPEASFGISNGILGGFHDKDTRSSRAGAGGRFFKYSLDLIRLQKMPMETTLLWKNQAQACAYPLAASQQIQLGGISNVRGYPSGENVGDRGLTSTLELLMPFYGVPKDIHIPHAKSTLYNALKFALFYDWGYARLKNPQAGEGKSATLRGAGFGFRFNLPEDFSVRADLAWPLGKTPSDEDHFHPWLSVSKEF